MILESKTSTKRYTFPPGCRTLREKHLLTLSRSSDTQEALRLVFQKWNGAYGHRKAEKRDLCMTEIVLNSEQTFHNTAGTLSF